MIPPYAKDGGEEAEIAAVYLVGPEGRRYRIRMTAGNECSDHQFEKELPETRRIEIAHLLAWTGT